MACGAGYTSCESEDANEFAADSAFDISRALSAHRMLDAICQEHFFQSPPAPRLPFVQEQNPFSVIRDTNMVVDLPLL
jgi:hypothetical protein